MLFFHSLPFNCHIYYSTRPCRHPQAHWSLRASLTVVGFSSLLRPTQPSCHCLDITMHHTTTIVMHHHRHHHNVIHHLISNWKGRPSECWRTRWGWASPHAGLSEPRCPPDWLLRITYCCWWPSWWPLRGDVGNDHLDPLDKKKLSRSPKWLP